MSITLEKPSARLPRAWVDGIAACKRMLPVGVIACKHIWTPTIGNPMVSVCPKCGAKVGPQREDGMRAGVSGAFPQECSVLSVCADTVAV